MKISIFPLKSGNTKLENCAVVKNNIQNVYMLYVGNKCICIATKKSTFYKFYLSAKWNCEPEAIERVWVFINNFQKATEFCVNTESYNKFLYNVYSAISDMIACGVIKIFTDVQGV